MPFCPLQLLKVAGKIVHPHFHPQEATPAKAKRCKAGSGYPNMHGRHLQKGATQAMAQSCKASGEFTTYPGRTSGEIVQLSESAEKSQNRVIFRTACQLFSHASWGNSTWYRRAVPSVLLARRPWPF